MPMNRNELNCMLRKRSIPELLIPQILDYVFEGRPLSGHFLTAVFENNLHRAVTRADSESLKALPNLIRVIYSYCDARCWGSPKKVKAWNGVNAGPAESFYMAVDLKNLPLGGDER